MKKENSRNLCIATGLMAAFVIWTAVVCRVDVQTVGPEGAQVGLAVLNRFVHGLTGVHMSLYAITDWLGLVPLCIMVGFALLGLVQWIRRKQIRKVDRSILILGGFYLAVLAVYAFFETMVINFRPVLIGGRLEASYPSSTTVLVMCVMPTAVMQLRERIGNRVLRQCAGLAMTVFAVFMVVGRLISGVHWFSDVVGGALLSGGLVMLYRFAVGWKQGK